jgi:tetratricopeptide (TPR) repeat protein
MPQHFILRKDAETDLLSCAAYLAERITSTDGHAEAMSAIVPQFLRKGNVDLAAELANTIDDPYMRDRLLIAVAEKSAELDDDEYALQLAEAVEEHGMRNEALGRIALQKAARNDFTGAREIALSMAHPDGTLGGVAVQQAVTGLETEAESTLREIDYAGARVSALHEIALRKLEKDDAEKAVSYLELAATEAADIEHNEEKARAYIDIGLAFTEAGRNDRAIETFDKAKATAETIENMHRDAFLSFAAQGFLHAGSLDLADRTLDLVGDKTHMASCLLGYSRAFWKKDEKTEAIESLEEAYSILESQREIETRDHKSRFRLFTSIAAQFAGFEKGERAIEIAERIKDEGERTSALSQIAAVLTLRKEDAEARHAFRAIADDGDRVFALIGMSDAKEKNGERDAAVELLNEAAELSETVPQLGLRAAAYNETAKRLHSYGEAARASQIFGNALDTITRVRDESAKAVALAGLAQMTQDAEIALTEESRGAIRLLVVKAVSH